MMTTAIALAACSLAGTAVLAEAGAFLESQGQSQADLLIAKAEVEEALLVELSSSGVQRASQLALTEEELRPMFAALPKSSTGKLEPSTVRYALHRYFVQKHGWYMRGLDPAGGAWNASSPTAIMKERAPAYIQSLLEERLHGQGLGLHELAVFAATLSDLVHSEAATGLQKVFTALRLPTAGFMPRSWSDAAVKAFLVVHLIDANVSVSSAQEVEDLEKDLGEIYPAWPETYMWVKDLREAHDLQQLSGRNPFEKYQDTFDSSAEFVQEVGHHFGSFQNLECRALKRRLVEMEHHGTGRVHLSSFYAGGLKGDWTFTESVEYLRNLGALDETDKRRPSVVIPNYITSQTNCLKSSGFYSVCCCDECEGLLRHLERAIESPSETPARIAAVISDLPSESVDAPRNLSTALLSRLSEIAEFHGGRIPVYGRLFKQWMHHVYPRECPFPHVTGTTNPMSPEEWMDMHGQEALEASQDEMQRHHRWRHDHASREAGDLPWSNVEELVAEYASAVEEPRTLLPSLRAVMALAALASLTVPLLQMSRAVVGSPSDSERKGEGVLV